jgi:glucosylceramidase
VEPGRPASDALGRGGPLAALIGLLAAAVLVVAGPAAAAASRTPPPAWNVAVVQTSANLAQRLTQLPDLRFRKWQPRRMPVIDVDDTIRYQPITGIGAALTDSAAWLIHDQLSSQAERKLIAQLFGFTGIRLGFLRVPIGGSDYDLDNRPYSYDDMPPGHSDPSLRHFSIGHDLAYILPTLRAALRQNRRLELLGNPWSPPAWMKANDSLENLDALGALRPSAYEPLARYFVKFIRAYARRGVPIGAITPQNEPSSGRRGAAYPGMTLPAPDEAKFIARDLRPALTAAHLHVKIYGNDLSWSDARDYAGPVARADARELTGISWHCYFG